MSVQIIGKIKDVFTPLRTNFFPFGALFTPFENACFAECTFPEGRLRVVLSAAYPQSQLISTDKWKGGYSVSPEEERGQSRQGMHRGQGPGSGHAEGLEKVVKKELGHESLADLGRNGELVLN